MPFWRGDALERVGTVPGELDLVALQLERAAERVPDGGLIVDDEDLHGHIVRVRGPKSA